MPRKLRLDSLSAELSNVISLLEDATQANDPVGKMQYEYRKEALESEIKSLAEGDDTYASVALFFGGEPVFGSRGISAEFAGAALEQFQRLVSRTFAKEELGSLGKRGPVPLHQRAELMVTELAKGSFGFVLDELSDQDELHETQLKTMVDEVTTIINKTASKDESDFESALEKLDARMLTALKDLFVTLDSSSATLRLVEGKRDLTFDSDAVRRGRVRTEATSINEEEIVEIGELFGFLPDHRKFELVLDSGDKIYGSVSQEVANQFVMMTNRDAVPVGKKVRVKMQMRIVTPLNRPEKKIYRMIELTEI